MCSNNSGLAPLRPLLSRARFEPSLSAESSSERHADRKREVVVAACEYCRKRKAKCDARRPTCSSCITRGLPCTYATNPSETRGSALKRRHEHLENDFRVLQESHDALQQVFQALRSREDEDALAIFQRIRQHDDAETIMEHLHASDLLLGLREGPHSRSVSVSCSASRPYMPRPLLAPDDSIFTRLSTTPIQVMPSNYLNREVRFSSSFRFLPCMSSALHSVKPHPSVKILDSRLDLITPSRWTRVSADDDMLRILLGRYFIQEYMRSACFQKDQFLHDMLSESMQFCSPLLVNATLALSCYCYHDETDCEKSRQVRALGYEFLAEAKKLWELDKDRPILITTIQAALVLSVTLNVCSAEALGMRYARAAVAMAVDHGLYDESDAQRKSEPIQQAHDFTAWCLHNWCILQGYQFVISPGIDNHRLPSLPDSEDHAEWYGEFWIQDSSTMARFCVKHAQLFKSRCEMLSILNQIGCHFPQTNVNAVADGV
ncbi:hypothetical protein E4U17_002343 [Claviceps sp. LM77 group G4]|nr:hypothetical protein E4U17_002343 [Claviceps sp. LM77 group G4]KAG6074718.1 hypothetical protein E4U33_002379 [Claviceps sp. LM78 group G4]KAG6076620.1 hypothetical protein E4U16_002679 [Claviceps sp. LM84 group G4]